MLYCGHGPFHCPVDHGLEEQYAFDHGRDHESSAPVSYRHSDPDVLVLATIGYNKGVKLKDGLGPNKQGIT
ncbi:hypothetical protein TNCV_882791 [Trichonephila clavipes]|nr:hypothetical protein TNCV_882791 [Trichonephila clavipes]